MKEQIRWPILAVTLFILVVWISDGATVEGRDAVVAQPLKEQLSCQDILKQLEEAVDLAGVRDTQAAPISGYPYYRINRFLASFAGGLSNDEARKEWLTRLLSLGNDARRVEMANLPRESFPKLPAEFTGEYLIVEIERCAERALAEDLRDPQRMKLLQDNASVGDEFNAVVRTIGLNPISSYLISSKVEGLNDEARYNFQRPEAMSGGKNHWYVPDRPRPKISHEKLAAIFKLARDKSALGIPEPDPETLTLLFDYYAPVWRISTIEDSDRIGRPIWQDDDSIAVDTDDAVVYRYPHRQD